MATAAVESAISTQPTLQWEDVLPVAANFGAFEFVKMLPSERDQNFLIRKTGSSQGEEQAVLKVHNPSDSADFVDCQNLALQAAEQSGASCQRLLRTASGETVLPKHLPSGGTCQCRVLTFLPGRMLADAAAEAASSEQQQGQLWTAVGAAVGSVTAALQSFDHDAAKREFVWDLQRCEEVISAHLEDVAAERRLLLDQLLAMYRQEVVPLLPQLRRSIVHNDPNDYNLVVDSAGKVGVLDFGDMLHSFTCSDAAICAAYLLFHCPEGTSLPKSLVSFVRGYHSRCPLVEAEVEAFFGLAVMRVCTSVCMSAYQSRLEPDNEYLLISAKPAWRLVERLVAEGPVAVNAEAKLLMKEACGFGPGQLA